MLHITGYLNCGSLTWAFFKVRIGSCFEEYLHQNHNTREHTERTEKPQQGTFNWLFLRSNVARRHVCL